jgi:phosphoribosylglycinamide formyltransferase-1
MSDRFRVAILVSGGGTNMENLIQAADRGELPRAAITLVLSNRKDAGAIARAQAHGITPKIIQSVGFKQDSECQAAVLKVLEEQHIDLICLAGYLKKVGTSIVQRFKGRILNIHPALLPKYGGAGMYGHYVHEAVLKAGDKESGCSVHLVDEEFDHGRVLGQTRVPVKPGDTPETLAERILVEEHKLYPKVLREFCEQLAVSERGEIND